jgi:RHS repeat-associated protein
MPISITGGQNGPTTLEYDAGHNRVAKRGTTDTTLYVQDLYECTGPTSQTSFACLEQHFKIFAGGKQVAEVTRDQLDKLTTKYIHSDHLGSATLITDETGSNPELRTYDPFGQASVDLTSNPVKTGFTGQEHDADLGLINMKGRMYDPTSRRFLTPDPFIFDLFNPQGLNRYAYVTNNPLNLIDPSGFEGEDEGEDNDSLIDAAAASAARSGDISEEDFSNYVKALQSLNTKGAADKSGYGAAQEQQQAQTPEGNSFRGTGAGYPSPAQPGAFCGPGGDIQAPANQNSRATPVAINAAGNDPQSTSSGTPSPAPATIGDFGPWQGLAQLNSFNQDSLAIQRTPTVAIGAGLVAGTPAAIGAALGLSTPAGGSVLVLGAPSLLGLKFVGGAVSGATSAALQGQSAEGIGIRATVGGVVNGLSPFGDSGILSAMANSATSNHFGQAASSAFGPGGDINIQSTILAAGARGYIGVMMSGFSSPNSVEGIVLSNAISGSFGAFTANWSAAVAPH